MGNRSCNRLQRGKVLRSRAIGRGQGRNAALGRRPSPSIGVVAEIDRRIRALENAAHDPGVRSASTPGGRSDDEIFKRVHELLAQSETKQLDQLALRIAQVVHDVDAQRVADLTRIQQGFRGIQASVTEESAQHRELTNYLLSSTSSKQK
jgi:hypothetical protein